MSIEQVIHQRWRTWRPLTELVPEGRFVTGWLPAGEEGLAGTEPYVLLERVAQRMSTRTSDRTSLLTVMIRFHIRAETLALAKQLAGEIGRRFERQEFQAADTRIQDMKRISYQQTPRRNGLWQIVLEYLTRAEELAD